MKRKLSVGLGLLALAGCGASPSPSLFSGDAGTTVINPGHDAGSGGTIGDSGITIGGNHDGATGTGGNSGCSAASQLVYVLSMSNDIYSFNPPTKTFTKVSSLQCNAGSMTPNSMAIDRDGNAWVNYVSSGLLGGSSGAIYKVDVATGSCQATNIALKSGWYQLGMGYSTASATDTTDTLYVAATGSTTTCGGGGGFPGGLGSSAGLAWVDTTAGTLTPIGAFTGDLAGQSAELTGTGDGRLFGFFVGSPVKVAQISKTSGATSSEVSMTGVPCPMAWAFSFWGGDFYMYTSADGTTNSTVSHYTTADGGIDTSYVANAGFVIVGAGVSTCAPTTPPPPQ